MATEWNQEKLQKLIDDQVEESHSLEYKAAGALSAAKKDEISKDVSAMANAAGGTLIYGIAAFHDEPKKHLPEKLSPVLRTEFSKERLEQLINSNIKPHLEGVVIHPVSLSSGAEHVAYVVEIPQSVTAHQASDFRYYRRYNFEVLPMLDHEIRDVMGRKQHPLICLNFEYVLERRYAHIQLPMQKSYDDAYCLEVFAQNNGKSFAEYVNCEIHIPKLLLGAARSLNKKTFQIDGVEYCKLEAANTHRDVMGKVGGFNTYGPSRYDPLLPGPVRRLASFNIDPHENAIRWENLTIRWTVYADNASPSIGQIASNKIPFFDRRPAQH
jgi:hypothetical protein